MHFCLDPQFRLRDDLITAIAAAAEPYDGVQIDFETVSASDSDSFYEFLSILKKKLGSKTFSVALPARTRNVGDAFDYAKISSIADRIIVMAYDEHWSGSAPGSIASLEWCRKVSAYSRSIIPPSKLVMGLPFYGRAWATANPAKAYRFFGYFAAHQREKCVGHQSRGRCSFVHLSGDRHGQRVLRGRKFFAVPYPPLSRFLGRRHRVLENRTGGRRHLEQPCARVDRFCSCGGFCCVSSFCRFRSGRSVCIRSDRAISSVPSPLDGYVASRAGDE